MSRGLLTRYWLRMFAFSAICLFALAAQGSIFGPGSGGALPDAISTNVTPGVFTSTIVVASSGTISDITVSLNLAHTYVGDLVALLTHVETSTTVNLFRRVKGDGDATFGDSSNLDGIYNFNDDFSGDLWAAASSGDSSFVIPAGDYFPSNNTTTVPIGSEALSSLSAFFGQGIGGSWTLTIQDWATSDFGELRGWTLAAEGPGIVDQPVPEAASAVVWSVLALVGGFGSLSLRRRVTA